EGEGPREKQVSFLRMFCKPCSAWVSDDSPKVIGPGLVIDRPYRPGGGMYEIRCVSYARLRDRIESSNRVHFCKCDPSERTGGHRHDSGHYKRCIRRRDSGRDCFDKKRGHRIITQTASSDEQGRYRVADLGIGEYELQASKPGFQTIIRKNI